MRVLFSTEPATGLLNHLSVVEELAARGHEVTIAVHGALDSPLLEKLARTSARITVEQAPAPGASGSKLWLALAADIRSSLDFLTFLDDRFNETYRARSRRRVPRPMLALAPLFRFRLVRSAIRQALELAERVIPADPDLERYFEARSPAVVLFTPYVGLRTLQAHYLRAAKALGLRTAICVKSWDNLTSKSALRPVPERVFVWNETQRREAKELHGIGADRVVITGAQCFDHWLDGTPRDRTEFTALVGLRADRPIVLYTCCAPWTGQSEAPFVRRWLEALRAAGDTPLVDAGVLVRPHPKRPDDVSATDLEGLGSVVVWPEHGTAPVDSSSQQDYLDSFFHSAAVVGLNTTAMLEAALLRRQVLTVLDPEYRALQEGTLHFRYMLDVSGGLVDVAETLDEHVGLLEDALRPSAAAAERSDAFVSAFLRPHGRDVRATPIFVDEVERLAATAAPSRSVTPFALLWLRPLLWPVARRAAAPKHRPA